MIKNNIKNQKGFFRFLLKFFLFLFFLFILDYSIGNLLKYLYFKQASGSLYNITYSIDSTKEEILVLGSSTAHHHFYPEAFENRLGMSFYNTGNDGTSILNQYAILRSVLKRYSPKIVILGFDTEEFKKDQESYDRLSTLLPYYYNHPELHPIINLKSKFENLKLLSKIYPFNSMVYSILIRNSFFNSYNSKRKVGDEGYLPIDRVWNKPFRTNTSDDLKYELDSNKIDSFKSFIEDCIDSNINLYIITSPRFTKFIRKDTSMEIGRRIADKFNIPYYNYMEDSEFWKHPEYFADEAHLNNIGAKIFSNMVIDTILKSGEYRRIKNENNLFGKK